MKRKKHNKVVIKTRIFLFKINMEVSKCLTKAGHKVKPSQGCQFSLSWRIFKPKSISELRLYIFVSPKIFNTHKRSCRNIMFLHVCHSVHWGVWCWSHVPSRGCLLPGVTGVTDPRGRHYPLPLSPQPQKRVVRILLECIIVKNVFIRG